MGKGKRVLSVFLLFMFLIGTGSLSLLWVQNPKHFPVRVIEVSEALGHISEEALLAAAAPYLEKGFFGLEVQAIQASIAKLPWVFSCSVKRLWPDTVQISLEEYVPQARFEKNEQKGVVDTEGRIFYPELSTISEKWPLFKGPIEKTPEMLQQYLRVLESLGPVGLSITELYLSEDGAWSMMLDRGIRLILGKTELNERLARFVLAYELNLKAQMEHIAYVDCRYTNGLAIGYKMRTGSKEEPTATRI